MSQPDLPQVIKQIAAYLHVSPDQIKCSPIRHGTLERNNVWRLTAMGRAYLLKQHLITQPVAKSIFTPFQTEIAVLLRLHQMGCRVPELYWWSESAGCLLMEWCGNTTLDDLAQETPIDELKQIVQNTVRAFCQLEDGFARSADVLKPYIYPLDYPAFLGDTMASVIGSREKNPRLFGVDEGRANALQSSRQGLTQFGNACPDRLHRDNADVGEPRL